MKCLTLSVTLCVTQVWAWCEAEWQAGEQGHYKESAKSFLISSWQGDALMVSRSSSAAGRDMRYQS